MHVEYINYCAGMDIWFHWLETHGPEPYTKCFPYSVQEVNLNLAIVL